jgi:uncharacterized repeat protein (TIGR03803 family)
MKNLFFISVFIGSTMYAQVELWGVTAGGGINSKGVLYKIDVVSNLFTKKIDFKDSTCGSNPDGSLIQTSNGKLYLLTSTGGINSNGVLLGYDPNTNSTNIKINFSNIDGTFPEGSLFQAQNGNLYGMTTYGGINNVGVIFQYNPTTNIYSKIFDFDGSLTGATPYACSFIEASDGNLYGMTTYGGLNNAGVLFQFNPNTNTYVKKIDFDLGNSSSPSNGAFPFNSLIEASDGMIYGLTQQGGIYSGHGVLFQYNISSNVYTKKYEFPGASNGLYPHGNLIQANNGKLYGLTTNGGSSNFGTIFQFDITTNIFTKKIDFNGILNGDHPLGSLMQASDGMLYGMTQLGGVNNKGVIFQYNPNTNVCVKIFDFNGINGELPYYTNLIEYKKIITDTKENDNENTTSINPNPNNGIFTIDLKAKSHITISDISGQKMLYFLIDEGKNNIDLTDLADGIYFIKITSNDGFSVTKKIFIYR